MIVYYEKLYCFREKQPPFTMLTNHSLVSDGYDRGYVSFAHCLLYFFNILVQVIFLIVALLNNVKVDEPFVSFPGIKIGKREKTYKKTRMIKML